MIQKTYFAKAAEINKKYYLIDAKDKILGRVATQAAILLRGKHKAVYTPFIDSGDYVIIVNAGQVRVTGNKLKDKIYQTYSGYPGGQKKYALEVMLQKSPAKVLEVAVNRMIPSGPLGNKIRTKLKVYAGEKHPHAAQKPEPVTII